MDRRITAGIVLGGLLVISILVLLSWARMPTLPEEYRESFASCMTTNAELVAFVDAVRSGSVATCEGFSTCEAVLRNNASLCLNSSSCKAMVSRDVSKCGQSVLCEAFLTGNASVCAKNVLAIPRCGALAAKNSEYLKSSQAKDDCVDRAYFEDSPNAASCANIRDENLRKKCASLFVRDANV